MLKTVEMHVNKNNTNRKELCIKCKHKDVAGNVYPCNCCWNPMGDMFVPLIEENISKEEFKQLLKPKILENVGDGIKGDFILNKLLVTETHKIYLNIYLNLVETTEKECFDELVKEGKLVEVSYYIKGKEHFFYLPENTNVKVSIFK